MICRRTDEPGGRRLERLATMGPSGRHRDCSSVREQETRRSVAFVLRASFRVSCLYSLASTSIPTPQASPSRRSASPSASRALCLSPSRPHQVSPNPPSERSVGLLVVLQSVGQVLLRGRAGETRDRPRRGRPWRRRQTWSSRSRPLGLARASLRCRDPAPVDEGDGCQLAIALRGKERGTRAHLNPSFVHNSPLLVPNDPLPLVER